MTIRFLFPFRAGLRRPHPHTYTIIATLRQYQPHCSRWKRTRNMDRCHNEANAHRDELFQLSLFLVAGRTYQTQLSLSKFHLVGNLAMADVVIGLFSIPFQFQAAVLQRWELPRFMCPFCPFVQILSVNVSIFTLTAIAIDRHKAILNPLRARSSKHASKIIIGIIWLIALLFATPISYGLRVVDLMIQFEVSKYCPRLRTQLEIFRSCSSM